MAIGRLTRFKVEAPAVFGIHQDRQGTLWILEQTYGTAGGVSGFDGQFEKVAPENLTMLEDRDRGLWLFGYQGSDIWRARNGNVRTEHGLTIQLSWMSGFHWDALEVDQRRRPISFSGWQIHADHHQGRTSQRCPGQSCRRWQRQSLVRLR